MNQDAHTLDVVGARIARQVLASEDQAMVDLRAQRGVGIDAVDELRPFYELKVYGGVEPATVLLTDTEGRRARVEESFFIIVVSLFEDGIVASRVRVITEPVRLVKRLDDTGPDLRDADGSDLVYQVAGEAGGAGSQRSC